ncbi:NAD-dependent epimerase [Paenibacillus methanolicus]|uniref:UDP-glucuronate 4-epimerase n=1 Tax=Paenibacillus methanolicus TaxID=582686 RepID=A0A5S5BVC9_9BACL|nr:NAD-dependent epimerase [Paenibacillus methanolicus]TYP70278.1 UDP-glucuronate 4-epimerase [Paenibacillus methanolicus]
MKILVTGAAGFIGSFTAKKLLQEGHEVVGLDNLNDYYDPQLKQDRLTQLAPYERFTFVKMDLENYEALAELCENHRFDQIIHLAAQAGVRYSLVNPHAYIQSNLVGFTNILEVCRHQKVSHLIYASSSSVYGLNQKMPFSENDAVDHPVSLYAATKKSNELLAHSYSHLYNIPTTGLRFFTVYGPMGRPDMAYFSFAKKIMAGEKIQIFNYGDMKRDFTYIDDIVEGITQLLNQIPTPNPAWNPVEMTSSDSSAPYRIYNIGNNQPVELLHFVKTLEAHLGKEAVFEFLPMQDGDVQATYADTDLLNATTGFKPVTPIEEGLKRFVEWFSVYYANEAANV